MSNNQEQLHNESSGKKNVFPEGFEMQWGTNDIPKGMKRRGSTHHSSHSGSSHHSSHHRSSRSSHSSHSNGRRHSLHSSGETKSTFQDLIFPEQAEKKPSSDSSVEKTEPKESLQMSKPATNNSKKWGIADSKAETALNEIVETTDETFRQESEPDPQTAGYVKPLEASETASEAVEETVIPEETNTAVTDGLEKPDEPESSERADSHVNTTEASEVPSQEINKPESAADNPNENEQPAENADAIRQNKIPDSTVNVEKPKKELIQNKNNTRKPWSKKKKIGASVLCVILALILGGMGFVNGMLNKIGKENSDIIPKADPDKKYEDIDKTDKYGVGKISLKPIKQDEVKNILLIGQDRRKGDGARKRSDSMIVATIDLTTNEIKLTSLMRDMYIPVPGYGYGMINATYLNGGMALLNETIEQNFGITIDGNVEVDFDRFVKLMDLVGPIDIDLYKEEVEYLNRGNGWHLKVGTNTMTSEQVLAYARTRYVGRSDWERTDRQRRVLTKIFNKLRTSDLPTMYRFANAAFPLFKTDLSNTEILRYVYTVMTNKMTITQSKRIPVDGTYTQEIKEETLHVLVPKLEPNAQALQKFVYGYSNVEVDESTKKEETVNSAEDNAKDNAEDAGKNNEKDTAKDSTKKKKSSSLVIE